MNHSKSMPKATAGEGLNIPPEQWKTGDEPATASQLSYLETLSREAGEDPPAEQLTKAEASRRIEELQEKTGRDGGNASGRD